MKAYEETDQLIICLDGRIDSNNASAISQEIDALIKAHPGKCPSFDADGLEYISSAGLRVFLALRKRTGRKITLFNVSLPVYDIFDTTGFTQLLDVRKKPRELSVEGCPLIGAGACGDVYRLDDDTVVKVYHPGASSLPLIEEERSLARMAFLNGVPTAIPFDIVRVDGQWGTVFEMVKAQSCNTILVSHPEQFPQIVEKYAELLRSVHNVTMERGTLPDSRKRYLEHLSRLKPFLSPQAFDGVKALITDLPEDLHLVHGDIHLKNVMYTDDSLMLIDMDSLGLGDPVFEFAGLFTAYIAFNEDTPDNSMDFFGLDRETCLRLFRETLCRYLGCASVPESVMDRIRLTGYLRFLSIVLSDSAEPRNETDALRLRHSTEHLEALWPRIQTLRLNAP